MKYLVQYTPYKHKQILNSEIDLLEFIFITCGGPDKYTEIYKIENVEIAELINSAYYKYQKRDSIIKRTYDNNLKIAYYEKELLKVSEIDCQEIKSFLSDKILKLYEEIKSLEEELKQYE